MGQKEQKEKENTETFCMISTGHQWFASILSKCTFTGHPAGSGLYWAASKTPTLIPKDSERDGRARSDVTLHSKRDVPM